jgi:cobyrinic acid a,c-diamide synthase
MNAPSTTPRLMIAGLSGSSGKTLLSLGMLLSGQLYGWRVCAFKKGPDYIDPAWLSWAAGRPAHNLDTFLMGHDGAAAAFAAHSLPGALNLIEGNRGLYDGFDAQGTHSTAELAKTLKAPVVLVLDATKVTRTAAAMVLGCQRLDPEVNIAAIILNQVCGPRHEGVLRQAIETACGIPVLGAVPRVAARLLPERHLGLVVPEDFPNREDLRAALAQLVEGKLEFDKLWSLACRAPDLDPPAQSSPLLPDGKGLRIGYLRDSAFTFYYPENLDVLRAAGAELIPISALSAAALPEGLDALYMGGGFPEVHAQGLAANASFLASLRGAAACGLPIYAECGGLMLLGRAITWQGKRHLMAGVLPFEVQVSARPQGHGYTELCVDKANPFFPVGLVLWGHEFHYSALLADGGLPATVCAVRRGAGCGSGRDAVVAGNVWASYTHLHALATPEWAAGMLRAAARFAARGMCTSPS